MICNQCPRKCNVDRTRTVGYCKSPEEFRLSRAALHFWEEPCISGKNGSGAVFFSGCNLGCLFCQNYEISHENKGMTVSDDGLIKIFENLIEQGANNINLVNPTHYAVQLATLLKKYKPSVPVVYNSSGYESAETLKMLDGLVDIYLPDFKYIRNDKALKYSRAEDYPEVAMRALEEMYLQREKTEFDENGIMKKGMIIRHLILPSNTNSSLKILDFINEKFPNAYVSLMAQYTPCNDLSAVPELDRKITEREYNKVVDYALNLGMDKIFIQSGESADEKFIPDFDFTGIIK
ncbi:radical SAM protein [Eubacterium sp.]|uniref:radical SAM protein n=1 Tax=Eubacterium sp. TaxID=142586 RepID=UPI0025BF70F1|nr:radical SAM protein [Eubacterium sp.]MCI7801603.1 radical SAM protein [Eubacterium sp.]MDD7331746.1 radical SAM protein [Eubacterium sp.]MDY5243366.1 radical SAM protein [Eubacterium sp.]